MVQSSPRSRTDPDIERLATELLAAGFGPTAVMAKLERAIPAARQPSERWVKRLSAKLKRSPLEPWRFMEADAEEAAAVLSVLGAVIIRTQGRVRSVTKAEAETIRRVVAAVPDVPPWTAYLLARQMLAANGDEEQLQLLVEFMASAPWRHVERYETPAEAAGLIPHDAEGAE